MTTIQLPKTCGADSHAQVCSCGQDLDMCTRAHCPRCGCARSTECYAPQLPLRVA